MGDKLTDLLNYLVSNLKNLHHNEDGEACVIFPKEIKDGFNEVLLDYTYTFVPFNEAEDKNPNIDTYQLPDGTKLKIKYK